MFTVNITIELPDDPLIEAALRYNAAADGYRSVEAWSEHLVISALQSGAQFGSKLFSLCESFDARSS